jgi:dipeptidyl aminopeptidase/acylaminoacyl peptidase
VWSDGRVTPSTRGGDEQSAFPARMTPEQVVARSRSFDELTGTAGGVSWVETVPETGRQIVGSWAPDAGVRLGSLPVGSVIHAYGGGVHAQRPDGAWVVGEDTGRVCDAVTGAPVTGGGYAYGDLAWGAGLLWCVREADDGDELITIDPATSAVSVRYAAPFLASPQAAAGLLAWAQWPAEVMPWDACEVWIGRLGNAGLDDVERVAGGPRESAIQPSWGPDGALYFLSDRSGWWNLHRRQGGAVEAVAPLRAECGAAPWELGYRSYGFLPGGRIGMIVQQGSRSRVVVVEPDETLTWLDVPFTSIKPYLAVVGERLALIGASATQGQCIALVDTDGSGGVEVIRDRVGPPVDPAGLSVPEVVTVRSDGVDVEVIVYPAAGVPVGVAAPMIVRAHPGPTHHAHLRLDWEVQFFTSRGFAVADVNYRGSTGYGRGFRTMLNGRWGEADVRDCIAAARHLIDSGHARPDAVVIAGASAGAYTALRAVSVPDNPFVMAMARSAIVSPLRWARAAPRFQRPHGAVLAGADSDVDPDAVCRPVLLAHGDLDHVAPFAAVADLARRLTGRGLLIGMTTLAGAGHSLTAPGALTTVLDAEAAALGRMVSASRSR